MKNYDLITTVIGVVVAIGSSVMVVCGFFEWESLELGNFSSRDWSRCDRLLLPQTKA